MCPHVSGQLHLKFLQVPAKLTGTWVLALRFQVSASEEGQTWTGNESVHLGRGCGQEICPVLAADQPGAVGGVAD